ncbi:MAG: polyphosphate kinase 2 [Hyphomicrobiales bacterium]|jgi:polyphosphate kinase 2|nr:polyphosphate kinase 2 [Hyphomicrobiales bacterium]
MPDDKQTKNNKAGSKGRRTFDLTTDDLPVGVDKRALQSGRFPYSEKLKGKAYEKELRQLQIELVRMLASVKKNGQRVVIVLEGRDAAGKGGAINRLVAHLNPRSAHVVALSKPTETEAGQWYFQRYLSNMPTAGQIAIFDRSWYNRAGVEPVFGFCTPQQTKLFLEEAPHIEAMLARDGVRLIKIFLSIGREMQMKRLHARWRDPLARWKLSDIDFKAIDKWDDYSHAYDAMLEATDRAEAPWTIIRANDKRRTRLEVIRHVLLSIDYEGKDKKAIGEADDRIVIDAQEYLRDGGEPNR